MMKLGRGEWRGVDRNCTSSDMIYASIMRTGIEVISSDTKAIYRILYCVFQILLTKHGSCISLKILA